MVKMEVFHTKQSKKLEESIILLKFDSSHIYNYILFDINEISLQKLMPLLIELLWQTDIMDGNKLISYTDYIKKLEEHCLDYDSKLDSLKLRGFNIFMVIETSNYKNAIDWYFKPFHKSIFSTSKIKNAINIILKSSYKKSHFEFEIFKCEFFERLQLVKKSGCLWADRFKLFDSQISWWSLLIDNRLDDPNDQLEDIKDLLYDLLKSILNCPKIICTSVPKTPPDSKSKEIIDSLIFNLRGNQELKIEYNLCQHETRNQCLNSFKFEKIY